MDIAKFLRTTVLKKIWERLRLYFNITLFFILPFFIQSIQCLQVMKECVMFILKTLYRV